MTQKPRIDLKWRRPGTGRFQAYVGAFPTQTRYNIEKDGREWRLEVARHFADSQQWSILCVKYAHTAERAKAQADEWQNPRPIDRNSSAYTDA